MGVVHHAVVFFDANDLVKEMLQVEFEAVLDQVVGLPEFAGREICACFLRINQRLQIVGAVFFLVEFDARGYVNRSWNVPLEHLLENAGRGPDLGSGRIRLACRSQCSVPWHSRQLWDPVFEGANNSFEQMTQALQRNRLGLTAEVPDMTDAVAQPPLLDALFDNDAQGSAVSLKNIVPKNTSQKIAQQKAQSERDAAERSIQNERANQKLQQEYLGKLTALKEEQQLQLATLKSAAQQQIDKLHQHYQIQLSQVKATVESTQQLLVDEKRRAQKLKENLATQTAEFQRAREQLQAELAQKEVEEYQEAEQKSGVEQLQQQFEVELKARVEQASAELKEMLDMREVELFYREEQLGTLREEIARLRKERERLINQGGDQQLQQLVESGVAFVAYQPGVDAMMIPASDIPRYLESPLAYVAEKCMVTVEQYQQWLAHHELPVCSALDKDGNLCGELLQKVERPNEFMVGNSDRCPHHNDEPRLSGETALDGEVKSAPRATQASSS